MARRRKGRDISGWLVVDKPAGPTSTDVTNRLRRRLDAKKAGHAGTLDPAATGIQAIAFGEATKTLPFVADADKTYRFCVRFGARTETDDAEGRIIDSSSSRPSVEAIAEALRGYEGEIMQIPPAYSAVKVEGERAYAVARGGGEVDLAPRPLWIEELSLLERPDPDHVILRMVCGKGGYVRAIARDLGHDLGCLGHVLWLRREEAGPFAEEDALTLEEIEAAEDPASLLLPPEAALDDIPELRATAEGAVRLRNGNPGAVLPGDAEYGDTAWASYDGRCLAIGEFRGGMLHPTRVLNQPGE
ncbi:tRNA pseudouridine(55) synthase TruB [Roseicyclus sp. F158]|uniref:tRNA pseudouridine synthase B n=1 Tax=Tropicimonas omnivorans TaxID=3075590 RepID=A0ABU3DCE7_9RHOB|nr:tRNA pseudouridine(55) synthase TruB [Roseicyclus sp. F158]MDT0681382.1 tRNA pseudouridine(55) synthase TruB [Roseicyclus sp. F158]